MKNKNKNKLKDLKPEENQELESIEVLFRKKISNEIKNEIDGIKKW